jgi:hypothetical protein
MSSTTTLNQHEPNFDPCLFWLDNTFKNKSNNAEVSAIPMAQLEV